MKESNQGVAGSERIFDHLTPLPTWIYVIVRHESVDAVSG
jgi:hypothetical protein